MKITLISEDDDEVIEMITEVIMLDDALAFVDRFIKASGFCYQGELGIQQPLADYVAEVDEHPDVKQQ